MVYIKTYRYIFNHFYQQYLVLLTLVPRNSVRLVLLYLRPFAIGREADVSQVEHGRASLVAPALFLEPEPQLCERLTIRAGAKAHTRRGIRSRNIHKMITGTERNNTTTSTTTNSKTAIQCTWETTKSLLRGTIVNRTYGIHKNLYVEPFLLTIFGPVNYGPP